MMPLSHRQPFEGVFNIIRFNWHFYVLAFGVVILAFGLGFAHTLPSIFNFILFAGAGFALFFLLVSLLVSYYVYDLSDLYHFGWLIRLPILETGNLINVHSGFDETSEVLKNQYPAANWQILDFYNPQLHTEISIARARKYRPVLPETISIDFKNWKVPESTIDAIFGLLAIHEIRSQHEKVAFFQQAYQALKPGGIFVLTEHLRNLPNLLAYGPGFLHFFPASDWQHAFEGADFQCIDTFPVTPFVQVFVLRKNI